MKRVLIVGAGGHAQVAADALLRSMQIAPTAEPIGFLDDDPRLMGASILGLPVLGPLAEIGSFSHDAVFVAIGDNATRARLFVHLVSEGEDIVNVVHPNAVLAPSVQLGRGILVCASAVVNTGTAIADNSVVNTGATVDHHCTIGAHCHIAPGVHLGGNVKIGEGSFLGIGTVVIPGRRIGEWSIVGAGSVVTRDIPSNVTAVGLPARVVKAHPVDRHQESRG